MEPVDFAGVTVRKATLNNFGDIQRKRVPLGCTVWIRRSNDVIPEITGRVEDGCARARRPLPARRVCPACGEPLVERGANLFCMNRQTCTPAGCGARLRILPGATRWISTALSEKTAGLLYDRLRRARSGRPVPL